MEPPEFLDAPTGRRIAFRRTPGRAGVVFLGGLRSDMTGTKAAALHEWAALEGRGFLRFDYSGHGASSGRFEEGSVGDWAEDAEVAISALTEGPQVLVGSSMGGWIGLLFARRAPERVRAFVGIAAAPDFTAALAAQMDAAARAEMAQTGVWRRPSAYSDEPYPIGRRLIEEGPASFVMDRPLRLPCPVRLLQGTADEDVPAATALRLLAHLESPDARAVLVKGADHRFSGPAELALLIETVAAL